LLIFEGIEGAAEAPVAPSSAMTAAEQIMRFM
jgi:hypothetical protein